jgi:hypothetical protein
VTASWANQHEFAGFKINFSRVSVGRPANSRACACADRVQLHDRSPLVVTPAARSAEIITESEPADPNDRSESAGRHPGNRTPVRIGRYRTGPGYAE